MEPPLLEIMKASGLTLLEDWDGAMIADASKPKLRAVYQRANLSIEIFGFEQSGPLCFVLLEVRGRDNPLPELRKICQTKTGRLPRCARMVNSWISLSPMSDGKTGNAI